MSIINKYADSDELLKNVDFIVEATSFEQQALWEIYNKNCKWEECLSGFGAIVGNLDNRSVMVSLLHVEIEGKVVLFWYPTSTVVDYTMIEEWLDTKTNGTKPRVDADNFHLLFRYIEDNK